ncbi:unnamed protein product [Ectocarpus sp. 6 AP-2014]
MQLEEMEEHPPPPCPLPSADSRARGGNAFMLRLHRAGLMEDTSRCVMDILEGRAAAAPNAGSSQAAHYGTAVAPTAAPAVTLEEVKEHLRSLPERYALTVSPEDVLDHMALFAAVSATAAETATQKHAASSSSDSAQDESLGAEPPTVRVVARPSPLALSSSHPAAAGDGEGGMSCGSGLAGVGRAYSLTVACRQSPLLLGAISSSLRSAGASCLDVDVVSTRRTAAVTRSCGLTLARLEVRVIGGLGLTAVSSAAAAAAAAAAGAGGTAEPSSASASRRRQRSSTQRGEMEEEEEEEGEMSRRLEDLLSSTIAAALLLAGGEGEGRSGQEEEEEEDGAGEREGEADIELLELAGKGRFSRTYRARWRGSTVAVKTLELPPEVDREQEAAGAEIVGDGGGSRAVVVAEFERELHIVSNLRHPNVCGFRGVSVSLPHHLSLVYDFLDNGTLGDRLRDTASSGGGSSGSCSSVHGCGGGGDVGGEREWGSRRGRGSEPLRPTDLLRIVTDVVNGMLYLHELGVMHRDLKPDNILLDADDRAVIADFGLSRFSHPTNDHTAETGTYRWMAPEVIRHEPYSQAADVYSFGVVLWQIVARKQPFKGLTPLQAAFSVAREGLRPQIPPSAPLAVARLIRRCWHRSPDSRPSFSQIRSELPEIERQMLSL